MDFEYNDKTKLALDRLQAFMDEHIHPNEAAYYRQHDELEDRWHTPPMMDELKDADIDADQIVVLEDGGIAGLGTHDELLETCAAYAEIVDSQLAAEAP